MTFEELLKRLVRNRNKDDLHSAMCYFKSGRVAYIEARYNKSLGVTIRDENISVDCSTVQEVLDMFSEDELTRFET